MSNTNADKNYVKKDKAKKLQEETKEEAKKSTRP